MHWSKSAGFLSVCRYKDFEGHSYDGKCSFFGLDEPGAKVIRFSLW